MPCPVTGFLSEDELEEALARLPGWRRRGLKLTRELRLRDFEEAVDLVERIAKAAVDYFRRPDMCISEFNRVRLTIENRHHAGFTLAEMRLLGKVEAILEEYDRDASCLPGGGR